MKLFYNNKKQRSPKPYAHTCVALSMGGLLFLSSLTIISNSASAALALATVQSLFAGTIVMLDVNVQSIITINSNDTGYSSNANTFFVDVPLRGEYAITGAPINAAYTITFPASTIITGPGGTFTADTFTSFPAILITNGVGEDTFYMGTTVTSLGDGTTYPDGSYSDTFNITFNF